MIKFLHCADLHLDSPFKGLSSLPEGLFLRLFDSAFLSFKRLVDLAIKEEVDFVIIAGDLYDSGQRSLKAQSFLKNCFVRLETHNIQVYISHGNHDPLDGQWITLDWPKNVHFFEGNAIQTLSYEKEGKTIARIHGFSYETSAITDNRTQHYPEKKDGFYHIGVLHGQADGYSGHSRYAPFLLSELLKKGYDYWALGHIHKKMDLNDEPPVRYSGNIQGRHSGETGEKGGYIVTLHENQASSRFVSTSDIEWHEAVIQLENFERLQEVITYCEEIKDTYRQDQKGVFLIITLSGHTPLYPELLDGSFIEELEGILREEDVESSFVYVVTIKNDTLPSKQNELSLKQSAFFQDVLHVLQDEGEREIALAELITHKTARKHISLGHEDWEEITKQAEQLLLAELNKG
ncbi:DNA repair exonuclease [Fictibacillus nanhaiensis]|uniref:metallophosphoesterase family protein n=1 Tax=Fictibacillus nanhaiensis TaxID=742169 RepID=UPI001C97EAFA|nr:DNA repair exonuclease [Fictibacillus nanhaiensis]MBY6037989.1 DNA repair exonuclease [Fictibacillus nanhaiensis]